MSGHRHKASDPVSSKRDYTDAQKNWTAQTPMKLLKTPEHQRKVKTWNGEPVPRR